MNKSVIFTLLAAFIFAACSTKPKSYVIEGVVPDDSYNNKMVYMNDYYTSQKIDSALVADGKFTLTGSVDTAFICELVLNRKLYAVFILENGKISVDMAAPESAKGTPMNNELSNYLTELNAFNKASNEEYTKIMQNQDVNVDIRQKQTDVFIEQYYEKVYTMCSKVFNANKNNILGTMILLRTDLKPDQFDLLYLQGSDVVRNYKMLQNIFEKNVKAKQTAEGMPFTNFTIENGNVDGNKASLSDYVGKGKYVLVDFWASWCGPCMAEIPVLIEMYNKYKGDKFDLLGVAVWDKREETLKSIESKNIAWSQIIDAGSIPTDLYGIRGIPHIILFAPDGTIVARNLRGDGLKAKVAEVMQ